MGSEPTPVEIETYTNKQKNEQNDRAWPLPKLNSGGGGRWRGACLEGTLGSLAVLDVARESPHNGVGNASLRLDHEVVRHILATTRIERSAD
jgi:hypothetical protein